MAEDAVMKETLKPLWKIGRDTALIVLPLVIAGQLQKETGGSVTIMALSALSSAIIYTGVRINDRVRIYNWSKQSREASLPEMAEAVKSIHGEGAVSHDKVVVVAGD